jgi:hypothetical protein
MLNWLKRTPAEPPADAPTDGAAETLDPGGPLISALLLAGDTFPFREFHKQFSKSQIGGHKPTGFKLDKNFILSFNAGDAFFALALMPAPYPWSDLEGPCATAWMWPQETPAATLRRHRTHLLCTMAGGEGDPIHRRLMLTAVTAAAAQQPGVMGVYWPEGTLVHYPLVFAEMGQSITSPDAPPLYLWVDFRVFRNKDGTFGLFTNGLRALGPMEIEIPRIKMPPGELRDWTVNIAYYLLENGPVLGHGHTIGMTAEQKIRISHMPSLFGHPGKVLRMEP